MKRDTKVVKTKRNCKSSFALRITLEVEEESKIQVENAGDSEICDVDAEKLAMWRNTAYCLASRTVLPRQGDFRGDLK